VGTADNMWIEKAENALFGRRSSIKISGGTKNEDLGLGEYSLGVVGDRFRSGESPLQLKHGRFRSAQSVLILGLVLRGVQKFFEGKFTCRRGSLNHSRFQQAQRKYCNQING
jgi:hypothetical protein